VFLVGSGVSGLDAPVCLVASFVLGASLGAAFASFGVTPGTPAAVEDGPSLGTLDIERVPSLKSFRRNRQSRPVVDAKLWRLASHGGFVNRAGNTTPDQLSYNLAHNHPDAIRAAVRLPYLRGRPSRVRLLHPSADSRTPNAYVALSYPIGAPSPIHNPDDSHG
jgi:hypothetical protein